MTPFSVLQLQEENWNELREIRLNALQTDLAVFSSNLEKESGYKEKDWRKRLENKDAGIFALYEEKRPIGMAGIALDKSDFERVSAKLWGSWIRPEYRLKGLSNLLFQARIDWATQHPHCRIITVSHRASNLASQKSILKYGFIYTHTHTKEWPDGETDEELFYERRVK